uniref:Uncharacterized protein n=1 Tax=Globodera rostochiensis TaxID=31243 RepID=A0A914HK42_GLORO
MILQQLYSKFYKIMFRNNSKKSEHKWRVKSHIKLKQYQQYKNNKLNNNNKKLLNLQINKWNKRTWMIHSTVAKQYSKHNHRNYRKQHQQTDQTNTSTIHEEQQQSLGQRSTSEQQKYKQKDNHDVLQYQLQNSSYVDQQDKMRSDLNQEKSSSQNDQHAEADKQVAEQQQLKSVHHQAVKQQTTANQVQGVQQQPNQQQQQQQQSATVEVKPVVLADAQEQKDVSQNSRQLQLKHVQAVPQQNVEEHFNKSYTKTMATQEIPHQHEDGAASQQQHNQNDLSFHVVKGFSTRGTKLSIPRSSLLIRRKGLRELTVTLLPPKVGQPIGPRISADRERQMTEIAIQERVDAIRKIEKGIQVDTNTEAPLPNWQYSTTKYEKHRREEVQTVSEQLEHEKHQQQQDHQPEVGQVLDKNSKSEEQHSEQETLQAKGAQTVQQPSVDEQKTSNQIYESKRATSINGGSTATEEQQNWTKPSL